MNAVFGSGILAYDGTSGTNIQDRLTAVENASVNVG